MPLKRDIENLSDNFSNLRSASKRSGSRERSPSDMKNPSEVNICSSLVGAYRSPKRFRRFGTNCLQAMKSGIDTDDEEISSVPTNRYEQKKKILSSSPNYQCDQGKEVSRIVRWKCDLCHSTDLKENYVLYTDGTVSRQGQTCNPTNCKHEKKTLLYVVQR